MRWRQLEGPTPPCTAVVQQCQRAWAETVLLAAPQIDSHTKFAPGWDITLVRMYRDLQSCVPKPVLTT